MKRILLALAALLLAALPASSQVAWPTPVGTMAAVGSVQMCLNPSGLAIPQATAGACGTQVNAIATGTTGAVTATIPAVAGVTNYICGFDVSAAGGTATVSPITVTGLLGGTFTYQGILSGGLPFQHPFYPCQPASAANTAISVVTTADATATAVDVNVWGFKQ
jgi:hypothetical protein